MQVIFRSPFDADVVGDSGITYLVNIEKETCTCIDWIMQTARMADEDVDARTKPTYACKHVREAIGFMEKLRNR